MTCSIRSHSISADCLKRIEFDDFIRQYFNKEEHTKLDALAKKLRRHIQVRCLTPFIDQMDPISSTRMLMSPRHSPRRKNTKQI
mmetsp:Transcript_45466/g.95308  ORF Transcript_45466/g.95308 Transcript_45466/m.95308 type:complete len:84 (+) Transcript_45466:204-455(+)